MDPSTQHKKVCEPFVIIDSTAFVQISLNLFSLLDSFNDDILCKSDSFESFKGLVGLLSALFVFLNKFESIIPIFSASALATLSSTECSLFINVFVNS